MVTVSLIILAGRNKENLNRCLNSIKSLTTLPDELIIVFDIKHHGEPEEIMNITGCAIKLIHYRGEGYQPHMRNIAIMSTDKDYLWFVDDDVTLDSDSCKNLKEVLNIAYDHHQIGAIAGRIIENSKFDMTRFKNPVFLSLIRGAVGYFNWDYKDFPNNNYNESKLTNEKEYLNVPFVQGTNMIFSRQAALNVGGFDEDLGFGYSSYEDSEICFSLSKKNYRIIYCPEIKLVHHKLPRISGATRGYKDFEYAKSLTRNYTISLLKNKYPSNNTSFLYVLVFAFIHQFRVYKYTNEKIISIKSIGNLYRACSSVINGVISGVKVVKKSNGKRIGLK